MHNNKKLVKTILVKKSDSVALQRKASWTKMSTDVPLLNDYKKKFIRHRLLQTFLSGLRLAGVPWYTIPAQIVIFVAPLGAVIPYYHVLQNQNLDLIKSLTLAAIIGKFDFLHSIKIVIHLLKANQAKSTPDHLFCTTVSTP